MGLKHLVAGAILGISLGACGCSDENLEQEIAERRMEGNIVERIRQAPGEMTYTITLPRRDNSGKDVAMEVYRTFAKEMSEHFGGVSIQPETYGCWHDKNWRKVKCEENIVFTASRDCKYDSCDKEIRDADDEFVENMAQDYARWLGQESVYVRKSYDQVDFVKGKKLTNAHESFLAECEDFSKLTGIKKKECAPKVQE